MSTYQVGDIHLSGGDYQMWRDGQRAHVWDGRQWQPQQTSQEIWVDIQRRNQMSIYRVGDTRKLTGNWEIWDGERWRSVVYIDRLGAPVNVSHLWRSQPIMSSERTVVVNNVTLTEGQVREAVRKLDAPTLGELKPGEYYIYATLPSYPRMVLSRKKTYLFDNIDPKRIWSVMGDGTIGYDYADVPVIRTAGFNGAR